MCRLESPPNAIASGAGVTLRVRTGGTTPSHGAGPNHQVRCSSSPARRGFPHGYPESQSTPRPRGTSPSGGTEPTADDPGEYYGRSVREALRADPARPGSLRGMIALDHILRGEGFEALAEAGLIQVPAFSGGPVIVRWHLRAGSCRGRPPRNRRSTCHRTFSGRRSPRDRLWSCHAARGAGAGPRRSGRPDQVQ